jgi:hypothetical protein
MREVNFTNRCVGLLAELDRQRNARRRNRERLEAAKRLAAEAYEILEPLSPDPEPGLTHYQRAIALNLHAGLERLRAAIRQAEIELM